MSEQQMLTALDFLDDGDRDQRENHRREMARHAIAQLPEADRETALRLEQAQIGAFEDACTISDRPPLSEPAAGSSFKCLHPNCRAPPFQTQYLLK